jgi:hypothetical protein
VSEAAAAQDVQLQSPTSPPSSYSETVSDTNAQSPTSPALALGPGASTPPSTIISLATDDILSNFPPNADDRALRERDATPFLHGHSPSVEPASLPPNRPVTLPNADGPSVVPSQLASIPLTEAAPSTLRSMALQPTSQNELRNPFSSAPGVLHPLLFLPHPNAPRAPASFAGPLYGRQLSPARAAPDAVINPRNSAVHALRLARHTSRGKPGPFTVYGKCEVDLGQALGPVLIAFDLEPPASIPADTIQAAAVSATLSIPSIPASLSSPAASANQEQLQAQTQTPLSGNAIPRANFIPKAGTQRPRSRSFSGFDSQLMEPVGSS